MVKRLIAALLGVSVIGGLLVVDIYGYVSRPVPLDGGVLDYEIEPGTSFQQLAHELYARGVIRQPFYWLVLARAQGKAGSIKAGEYRIQGPVTPAALLEQFVRGRTVQFSLTIPEGWTYRQLRETLARDPRIQDTLGADEDVMARLGHPGMHPEGWFYPDTYHFPKGATDFEFLRRAFKLMWRRLHEEWAGRAEGLPLKTPYEALVLASIVEKETARGDERPVIAAVFLSRLKRGMRLQTDPTVIYGMGEDYKGNIRARDLRADTPYNTYVHAGLPPTPIALPGGAAIHAVLHPASTPALYFVAKGDGSHHFSRSYEEHRKAVVKYQLGGDGRRYRARSASGSPSPSGKP